MRRENKPLHYLALAFAVSIALHITILFAASYSNLKKKIKFVSVPIEVSFYTPAPTRSNPPQVVEQKETIKQQEIKEEQKPINKEDVVVKKKEPVKEKPKPKPQVKKAKPEEKPKEKVKEEVKPVETNNEVETIQPAQNAEPIRETAGSQYESLSFDSQNFKYPFYANTIIRKIRTYWQWVESYGRLRAVIYFRILKDGSVTDITVKESSGDLSFDRNAERAVQLASPFAPLPDGYEGDSLGVHFEFKYRN
ncbi:MAG: TonB family protein [Endomicrobia bacterium]|nr:TonB family protein [Endomicrobiia bacterium]MCL2799859.1 TonB family protein [Endomicrobiia bacterium]